MFEWMEVPRRFDSEANSGVQQGCGGYGLILAGLLKLHFGFIGIVMVGLSVCMMLWIVQYIFGVLIGS